MKQWDKEVQASLLREEQRVLRVLKLAYQDVLRGIDERLGGLTARIQADENDTAAVWQQKWQARIREGIAEICDTLETVNVRTIEEFLNLNYTYGFTGAVYSFHRQDVPLMLPIRQENVVRAVTTNSKISVPLYTRLGNDIGQLKAAIAAETTRGIASGARWHDTAVRISARGRVSYNNAIRIARTEGHRIQCEAQMDACLEAREHGADVVKEWCAVLDRRVRPHHHKLHGQVRELEEPFEVDGLKAMQPGAFDRPEEDIHCRCSMLQQPRWMLGEEKLLELRQTKEAKQLADAKDFDEFREKYLQMAGESGIMDVKGSDSMALENQRYGRNKNTLVNHSYIESGEYRRKFDNITDNPEVSRTLYQCAKKALAHRSGTSFEDMYWIDNETGKIVLSVLDSEDERAIVYSDKIRSVVKTSRNLTTLHTHPSSMPPSIDDFNSSFRNGYRAGVVACHNGKVFVYSSQQEISKTLYDMYISSFYNEGMSEYDAQLQALEKLKQNYAIDFKEVL